MIYLAEIKHAKQTIPITYKIVANNHAEACTKAELWAKPRYGTRHAGWNATNWATVGILTPPNAKRDMFYWLCVHNKPL